MEWNSKDLLWTSKHEEGEDGRILLKWILGELVERAWTELITMRRASDGGLL